MSKSGAPRRRQRFVPPSTIYRIEVDEGVYDGVFLRVRSVPLGRFLALVQMAEDIDPEDLKANGLTAAEAAKSFAQMSELFREFSNKLIEWNVEVPDDPDDESEDAPTHPVPADHEGVMSQDFDFVMFLIGEWLGAMGGVAGPLEKKPNEPESSSGEVSEEDLASLSHPFSPVQS